MVRQIIYFQFYVCNYLCMVRQKLPSPFDVCIIYVCNTKKLMSYSCKSYARILADVYIYTRIMQDIQDFNLAWH